MEAIFVTTKNRTQRGCPPTDEWLNKLWYIPSHEILPEMKRDELLIHTTTLMDLQGIMKSEMNT